LCCISFLKDTADANNETESGRMFNLSFQMVTSRRQDVIKREIDMLSTVISWIIFSVLGYIFIYFLFFICMTNLVNPNYDPQLVWAMIEGFYSQKKDSIFLLLGTLRLRIMLQVSFSWNNVCWFIQLTYSQYLKAIFFLFFCCQIIISYDVSCMLILAHKSFVEFKLYYASFV
jgi:hypothetical protein